MPLIKVTMFPGREPHQKTDLVRRLTETFLEVCGTSGQTAEGVWVILEEVPPEQWGVGGQVGGHRSTGDSSPSVRRSDVSDAPQESGS